MDVETQSRLGLGFLRASQSPDAQSKAGLLRHLADRPDDIYYFSNLVGVSIPYTKVDEYVAVLDTTYPPPQ